MDAALEVGWKGRQWTRLPSVLYSTPQVKSESLSTIGLILLLALSVKCAAPLFKMMELRQYFAARGVEVTTRRQV